MNAILSRLKVIAPILILLLVFSSCRRGSHEAIMFTYTFSFFVVLILFLAPGIIMGGLSRGSSGKALLVLGIVFTSLGGLFGLIYTINALDVIHRAEELYIYIFLIWAIVGTSIVLMATRKAPVPVAPVEQPVQQTSPSDADILRRAEEIKRKQGQGIDSEYLRPEIDLDTSIKAKKPDSDDVDMSGLDDL